MSDQRREHLHACLMAKKLQLRDDSVICKKYIDGHGDRDINEIVHEMALMHWLHNYTTYKTDLSRMVDHLVARHGVFKGVWRKAATHIKIYHTACHMPESWPWLSE